MQPVATIKQYQTSGFTLMEILIVVVIIATLGAVSMPLFKPKLSSENEAFLEVKNVLYKAISLTREEETKIILNIKKDEQVYEIYSVHNLESEEKETTITLLETVPAPNLANLKIDIFTQQIWHEPFNNGTAILIQPNATLPAMAFTHENTSLVFNGSRQPSKIVENFYNE